MLIFFVDIFMMLHHKSMKRHHHRELNEGCTESIWLTEALFFCFFCVLNSNSKISWGRSTSRATLFGGVAEFSHPVEVLMQHAKKMRFVHTKYYLFTSELKGYHSLLRKKIQVHNPG